MLEGPAIFIIKNISWLFQFALIKLGLLSKIFGYILSQNQDFCVTYREHLKKKKNCEVLFASWATYFSITLVTFTSIIISSIISKNLAINVFGVILALSSILIFLYELWNTPDQMPRDLIGVSLLAATLTAAYSLLSSLAFS